MREACKLFNQKPKLCFEFLRENNLIPILKLEEKKKKGGEGEGEKKGEGEGEKKGEGEGEKKGEEKGVGEGEEEEEVGREGLRGLHSGSVGLFLLGFGEHLDEVLLGDYLSDRSDTIDNIENIREDYFNFIDLKDMEISAAMRKLLTYFRLPGESQKIERILESFAKVYFQQQTTTGVLKNSDTVCILAYSLIMLNTDAHNPQVKRKMKKDEFIKNNRGINDGEDLPMDFLGVLYDDIVQNEIKTNGQIYPRAPKRGLLSVKAASWGRYVKRWAIINDGILHIFKSESEIQSILDIPLKGMVVSLEAKRKKITFFSKDIVNSSSGNFPFKIEVDNEKDYQEWSSLLSKTDRKDDFLSSFATSRSPRPLIPRPQRSLTGGSLAGWEKTIESSEEVSEDLESDTGSDISETTTLLPH